ncbi:porphobilinogen synthase [Simkania negevensis]|uniref:Delta-aminolevulinic acid dehydratase n=1 Tax=Simkania negevensis TaxID=83561 RepID=A0ABS3AS58_9BACT|nr:porphobilinogen synthase [Simkania negevensis]
MSASCCDAVVGEKEKLLSLPLPTVRMRRLRSTAAVRDLVRESHLLAEDFVAPLFVREDDSAGPREIVSMPGYCQWTLQTLGKEVETLAALGVRAVMLFGIPIEKDAVGSSSWQDDGIVQKAIKVIKDVAPEIIVMTDLCFCEHTDHGHCGVVSEQRGHADLDNDTTLPLLAKQALSHARAGADVLAPSGMVDGMVAAVRFTLDCHGFSHVAIITHAAKFCSALYGPFRDAIECGSQFGHRRSYQIDPANGDQALREIALDVEEGADMLMIKPAGIYLDIVRRAKEQFPAFPIATYFVSGEYAMVKAAAEKGWIDEDKVSYEMHLAAKRAGADILVTYFTKQLLERALVRRSG